MLWVFITPDKHFRLQFRNVLCLCNPWLTFGQTKVNTSLILHLVLETRKLLKILMLLIGKFSILKVFFVETNNYCIKRHLLKGAASNLPMETRKEATVVILLPPEGTNYTFPCINKKYVHNISTFTTKSLIFVWNLFTDACCWASAKSGSAMFNLWRLRIENMVTDESCGGQIFKNNEW